jgi:hypothetical protein
MVSLVIIPYPTIPCSQTTLIMSLISLLSFAKKIIFNGKKQIICNVKAVTKGDKT